MRNALQQLYIYGGLLALVLLGYGTWGLITNSDAASYQLAEKRYVAATVTGLVTVRQGNVDICQISLDQSGQSLTVRTDDANPCEQLGKRSRSAPASRWSTGTGR